MLTDHLFPTLTVNTGARFFDRLAVWIVCLLSVGAISKATDPGTTPPTDPIEQQVDRLRDRAKSTADMVEAEEKGANLWDQEMNRVYRELMRRLPKEDQSILKDSQQEWLKFRDSNLKLIQKVYGSGEGTIYHVLAARAALDAVHDRAIELRDYLDTVEFAWPDSQ